MLRFKYPTYDLLKYGQQMKKPVSRRNFARQVVDLATQLALSLNSSQQIQRSIELLHNQISGLRWKTYIFIIPVQSHSMSRDTCGPEGREDLLPESLLATVSFYKSQLNFANQDLIRNLPQLELTSEHFEPSPRRKTTKIRMLWAESWRWS